MESRALVFCLDDIPGANELFAELEPQARRFVCVAGAEDVVERVFASFPEYEDEDAVADAADAASDWLDEETFSDLFEPTWDELDAEPEIDIVAGGVALDDLLDGLRADPNVFLLRDRLTRPAGELDPRIGPHLARLGATVTEPGPGAPIRFASGDTHEIPPALRRFLQGVRWPAESVYSYFDWAGGLRFDLQPFTAPTPIDEGWPQTGGVPFVVFAHANGGSASLLVRLDDPDPANPMVYRLEADDKDELPFRLATLARLVGNLHRDLPLDAIRPPR